MKPPYFTISGSNVDGWKIMKYTYVTQLLHNGTTIELDAVSGDWIRPKIFDTMEEVINALKEYNNDQV